MIIKRIFYGGLIAAMVLPQLTGCGNVESAQSEENMQISSSEQSANVNSNEESVDEFEDIAEIVVAFPMMYTHSNSGIERVEEAINEITIPKIQTSVTLYPVEVGNYGQQMSLMISSNEQIDLMPTFFYGPVTYTAMMAQKQLLPLTDLLENYGTGIISTLPDYFLDTTTVDGEIYAVPSYKDEVPNIYIAMRKDVLDDLDLWTQAEQIQSIDDLEEIFAIVKEKTDLYPVGSDPNLGVLAYLPVFYENEFSKGVTFDDLLNDTVVVMENEPDTVVSLFHTDIFESICQLTRQWYENGYIYVNESGDLTQNFPNVFACFLTAEHATHESAMAAAESMGYEYEFIKLGSGMVTTATINTIDWVIPVNSKEPEAAMKFMNMMYTEKAIVDLLNYGQEGIDYIVNEDGTYGFPEGVTATTAQYYDNLTWLFGNQYLSGVWEGGSPDTREISAEINKNAEISPLMGFAVDITDLDTEIAAVSNTYNEFFKSLSTGLVDVDTTLPEFRQKLEANGVNKIIERVQQQLDDWKNQQ